MHRDYLLTFKAPLIKAKALVLGLYFGLLICVDSWWQVVAGCGRCSLANVTEEHGVDPFAGSEPSPATSGYQGLHFPYEPYYGSDGAMSEHLDEWSLLWT